MHRRRFLTLTGAGLAGAGAFLRPGAAQVRPPASSDAASAGGPGAPLTPEILTRPGQRDLLGRIAVAREVLPAGARPTSNVEPLPDDRARERLDAALAALLGPEPWRRLFSPQDTVAIKINGLAAGHLSPRTELVWAIVAGLQAAGVSPGRIIIWDRATRELERCGFSRQTGPDAVRVYGTDALRAGGYGTEIESCGSVGSLVSEVLARHATALVNVGVLKDHDLAGVSAGLKNLYGVIHNPNRYHDRACDPYVAEVAGLPSVRRRLRLTVIDAVLGQAQGGPAYAPAWIWRCDRLIAAVDPVVVDQLAWDLIEGERAARGLARLAEEHREPAWIATAARLGLGQREPASLLEV